MKHARTLYYILLATVVVFAGINPAVAADATSEGVVVVKAVSGTLMPEDVTVKRGTSVVWVNREKDPIKIIFLDDIEIACKAPANFYADLLGHYESVKIPNAGTASLCIIHPGIYKYEVHRRVSEKGKKPYEVMLPGKVVVEK